MSKTHITISVDNTIYSDFQTAMGKGNISAKLEEYMANCVNIVKSDSNAINIKLLNNEINQLEEEQSKISSKLTKLRHLKEMYVKAQAEAETKKLEEEKERIENQNRCANCGNVLGEKQRSHKFAVGLICNPCFMTSNSSLIKKWSGEL
jgi:DNA repair exonuclease SbcCD ATPase subunit